MGCAWVKANLKPRKVKSGVAQRWQPRMRHAAYWCLDDTKAGLDARMRSKQLHETGLVT